MKRIVSILLVIITLASLCACGNDNYAMKYDGITLSQNEYLYWLSSYKALFLSYYLGGNDTDEAWLTQIADNGTTVEDLLGGIANDNIKNNLVCMSIFDRLGLKLDKESLQEVDTYVSGLTTTAGSTSALDSALSAYGVDSKLLKNIYTNEKKIEKAKTALFDEGGELELTYSEMNDHYKKAYVRVKHIYINSVQDFAKDDEGDLIIDSDTGTYKTRALTDEEKAEKIALAESINAQILAGGNFDELMAEHTADTAMINYPNGYYVTTSSRLLPTALIEKAFTMNNGESAYIESEIGIHIIKREPLEERGYEIEENAPFFSDFKDSIMANKLSEYLSTLTPGVTVNEDITGAFSIRTCTPNYSY